jgi:hypothetical protein|tara:strand:- start:80 stop:379 length:300 start_codon:yes stop_codon:yes gene_type:complete
MKLNDAINKILDYELDEEHYSAMPTEFWVNEEFIMTCIGNGHNTTAVYNYIDKSMWSNKKFILSLINFFKNKEDWHLEEILDLIDPKLTNEEDIAKALK